MYLNMQIIHMIDSYDMEPLRVTSFCVGEKAGNDSGG